MLRSQIVVDDPFGSGSMVGNRLAIIPSLNLCAVATTHTIHSAHLPSLATLTPSSSTSSSSSPSLDDDSSSSPISPSSLDLPSHHAPAFRPLFTLPSAIQSLASHPSLPLLLASDDRSALSLTSFSHDPTSSPRTVSLPAPLSETGPSCCAFLDATGESACVASYFDKSLRLFDLPSLQPLASIPTHKHPLACVSPQPHQPRIALAEETDFAMYDARANAQAGRVPTVSYQLGTLYAVASDPSSEHGFAVAGSGRSVAYVDTRKWRVVNNWSNLTKYEITSLHIAKQPEHLFVVGALDSQMAVYALNPHVTAKRSIDASKGFLADSRWTGMRLHAFEQGKSDGLVGMTQSGHLYFTPDVSTFTQNIEKRPPPSSSPSSSSTSSSSLSDSNKKHCSS